MQRIREGGAVPPLPNGTVVTIGTFDGVHLGHQAVLRELHRRGAEYECPSVVVTFDRHPASVVRPESAPRLLTTLSQRLDVLDQHDIDYVSILRFDEDRSLETPEEFLNEIVVGTWHARAAVEGENFHFGHRRRGDVSVLEDSGARLGFKVHKVPLLRDEVSGEVVSSDLVRHALATSDIEQATRLLGRPYEVLGVVEHGDARGATIGFPTANLAVPGDIQLPAEGVFAGEYERPDGSVYTTAISIGRRPTFYAEHGLLLVEAHLLDFDGDLYDEHAKIRITHWLRGQARFGSVEDLKAQLARDVDKTRRVTAT